MRADLHVEGGGRQEVGTQSPLVEGRRGCRRKGTLHEDGAERLSTGKVAQEDLKTKRAKTSSRASFLPVS